MNALRPVTASEIPPRLRATNYPPVFASRVAGREKRALGDLFGLKSFGVNRTTLKVGAVSALRHWHHVQDEFVYILSGRPTLVTEQGEVELEPGMCMGFRGGDPNGHHLVNRSSTDVVYLEIGDRLPGDSVSYPDDDLKAVMGADGKWQMCRKDGSSYSASECPPPKADIRR